MDGIAIGGRILLFGRTIKEKELVIKILLLSTLSKNSIIRGGKMIPLPKNKYNIIYADPPWSYNSRMAEGRGAKRSSSEDYYKTMSLEEICMLPVNQIADKDCVLFLWTTFPKIYDSKVVIESWGFEYKTCAFVWVKRNKVFSEKRNIQRGGIDDFMGQGRWTRQNAEVCLLATKGNVKRLSAKVRQIIYEPIREHSRKPDRVRNDIIELVGDLPKIELFARQKLAGWDYWGNEIMEEITYV